MYSHIDAIINAQDYTGFDLQAGFTHLLSHEHIFISCSRGKIDFTHSTDISDGIKNRLQLIIPYLQRYFANIPNTNIAYNFILGLGDAENLCYPSHIPCISLSKKEYMRNILIPNIDFFSKALLLSLDTVKDTDLSFDAKVNGSVFAGASTGRGDSCNKRIRYCLAMNNDNNYAKITNLCQGSLEYWQSIYPNITSILDSTFLDIKDQLKYKILINIDGNSLCYSRLYWQLASNSIPVYIEPDTSTQQFFDRPEMKDGYFSALIDEAPYLIQFIIDNPTSNIVQDKIRAGQDYCQNYFSEYCANPEDVLSYIVSKIFTNLIEKNRQ